jgi:hypothetical protein
LDVGAPPEEEPTSSVPGALFGAPGLATACGLFVLLLGLVSWKVLIAGDADLATHLSLGRLILENGLPDRVPLLPGHGGPWEQPVTLSEWGIEVTVALVFDQLGWSGLLLVFATLLAAPFWLLAAQLRAKGLGFWGVLIPVLIVLLLSVHHVAGRPHLITWALIVPWTALWRSWAERRHSDVSMLAITVPWVVVWANLHGGFLAALVVAGLVVLGAGPPRWLRGGSLLVACLAAGCLTPWGPGLYGDLLSFLTDREVIAATNDFKPVALSTGLGIRTLLAVLAGGAALAFDARRRPWDVALWVAFSVFAFGAVRNVPIAAWVLAAPIAESAARAIGAQAGRGRDWARALLESSARMPAGHAYSGALWLPVAALLAVGGLAWSGIPGSELPPDRAPASAWRAVESGSEPIFTDFMYGGFVLFWGGNAMIHPVNNIYPRERLDDYVTINQAEPGWRQVLDRNGAHWLLVRPDVPIAAALRAGEGCSVRYEDALALVARCE